MNRNMDYYSRGIANAFARRKAQQPKQNVQKADNDASNVATTAINTTTQQSSDEQYQTTIIQLMVNHIRQKKESKNDRQYND